MKLLSLTCNHCGAPLEVPAKTRFLTCSYCSARLEVQRSGGAVFTEVLEALDERTRKIAEDVEAIKIQNRLEQMDRQWTADRERYMSTDKHGRRSVPTTAGSIAAAVAACVGGTIWMITAASMPGSGPFPLFGLIVIAVGIFIGIHGVRKAEAFQRARRRHQMRRREVLRQLDELKREESA